MKKLDDILGMLTFVAKSRAFAPGAKSWDYGWCLEEYRRSPTAAIGYDRARAVTLTPSAVGALENAVHLMLKTSEVLQRWDAEEFWGVIASMVGTLPEESTEEGHRNELERRIALLSSPGSLVGFPIANVKWALPPLQIGDITIGVPDNAWHQLIESTANGRPTARSQSQSWWLSDPPEAGLVAAAAWVPSLGRRAVKEARHLFDQVIELTLLLELELEAKKLWSGRGSLHRPGVRGLVLDRAHVLALRPSMPASFLREFSTSFLVQSALGTEEPTHWFGEDPFPLDELLTDSRREAIVRIMSTPSDVHHRLMLTARWHAKAHWSLDPEDAVLSLGIAFDALLGEEQGPQRREIAERFALLEPKPSDREPAFRTFADIYYTARSEVAHGQRCSALERPKFTREMSAALRAKAAAVYQLIVASNINTEAEYAAAFKSLKWGTSSSS